MIRFFRAKRKGLLAQNKFLRYLTYAAGEILLVMIGILAALKINNWNEAQKLEQRTEDILRQIQEDLRTNIYETATSSNYYFYKDSLIQRLLENEIDFFDFDNPYLGTARSPLMTVAPLTLIDNGFQNWAAQEQIPEKYQKMNEVFNKLFVDWKSRMIHSEEKVTAMVDDNVKYLADHHPWFYARISSNIEGDLLQQEANYYQNDTLYKNKVSLYHIYAISDYLPLIDAYRNLSVDAYLQIDEILGEKLSPKKQDFFLRSQAELQKFTGTYQAPNDPALRPVISLGKNGLIYTLGDFQMPLHPISDLSFLNAQIGPPAKLRFQLKDGEVYTMSEGQYGEYTVLKKVD